MTVSRSLFFTVNSFNDFTMVLVVELVTLHTETVASKTTQAIDQQPSPLLLSRRCAGSCKGCSHKKTALEPPCTSSSSCKPTSTKQPENSCPFIRFVIAHHFRKPTKPFIPTTYHHHDTNSRRDQYHRGNRCGCCGSRTYGRQ